MALTDWGPSKQAETFLDLKKILRFKLLAKTHVIRWSSEKVKPLIVNRQDFFLLPLHTCHPPPLPLTSRATTWPGPRPAPARSPRGHSGQRCGAALCDSCLIGSPPPLRCLCALGWHALGCCAIGCWSRPVAANSNNEMLPPLAPTGNQHPPKRA